MKRRDFLKTAGFAVAGTAVENLIKYELIEVD